MPNCWIRRNSRESIRTATLQTECQMWNRSRLSRQVVRFNQPFERLPNGRCEHREFRTALLLLEYEEWLRKIRISFFQFFPQNRRLRMLASQAQHRRAGHIGMVNVSGNQSTEVRRSFPRSAPAPFVQQKLNSVHVFKDSLPSCSVAGNRLVVPCLPLVLSHQIRHLPPVRRRRSKSKLFLERL